MRHEPYEVTEILQKAGVAAAPCLDTEGRFFDPHFRERELCLEVEHPATGVDFIAGVPWKLSRTPGRVRRSSLLGEHNDYVFRELLGLTEIEVASLKEKEVIY
jgi:crotonobetainyl-CoA:carnitine CoA-transferase CaiB-like acyl-CoA transferase